MRVLRTTRGSGVARVNERHFHQTHRQVVASHAAGQGDLQPRHESLSTRLGELSAGVQGERPRWTTCRNTRGGESITACTSLHWHLIGARPSTVCFAPVTLHRMPCCAHVAASSFPPKKGPGGQDVPSWRKDGQGPSRHVHGSRGEDAVGARRAHNRVLWGRRGACQVLARGRGVKRRAAEEEARQVPGGLAAAAARWSGAVANGVLWVALLCAGA